MTSPNEASEQQRGDEPKPTGADEKEGSGFRVIDKRTGRDEAAAGRPEGEPGDPTLRALVEENEILREELDARRARVNELARGIQNLQEECDATRARVERDKDRAVEHAKGELLARLVPLLDQFEHSLDAVEVNAQTRGIVDGVQLIYRQFLAQLDELGLQQYDPAGAAFDPAEHEAMAIEPVQDQDQDGLVLRVLRSGYRHHERILRPAQVVVGRGTEPATKAEEKAEG